jgi:hypothetical protein
MISLKKLKLESPIKYLINLLTIFLTFIFFANKEKNKKIIYKIVPISIYDEDNENYDNDNYDKISLNYYSININNQKNKSQ